MSAFLLFGAVCAAGIVGGLLLQSVANGVLRLLEVMDGSDGTRESR